MTLLLAVAASDEVRVLRLIAFLGHVLRRATVAAGPCGDIGTLHYVNKH